MEKNSILGKWSKHLENFSDDTNCIAQHLLDLFTPHMSTEGLLFVLGTLGTSHAGLNKKLSLL